MRNGQKSVMGILPNNPKMLPPLSGFCFYKFSSQHGRQLFWGEIDHEKVKKGEGKG